MMEAKAGAGGGGAGAPEPLTGREQHRQGRELKASDQTGVLLARPAEDKAKGQESHRQKRDWISMALVQVNTHPIKFIS